MGIYGKQESQMLINCAFLVDYLFRNSIFPQAASIHCGFPLHQLARLFHIIKKRLTQAHANQSHLLYFSSIVFATNPLSHRKRSCTIGTMFNFLRRLFCRRKEVLERDCSRCSVIVRMANCGCKLRAGQTCQKCMKINTTPYDEA